ncbi:MAG: hypothetical protein WCE81_02815 [Halobacteriota archaeon]
MKCDISATRAVASTVGVLAGLLGVEHGLFETLQGNVATSGPVIDAIGHQANSVFQGSEPALTFIPNFFVTGVLAIIVSLIVIIWATAFVGRKNGGLVLILLSIIQLFVGGGLASISLAIIAGLVATRIHAPLTWWRVHLSINSRHLLAKLWPWPLIAFFLLAFIDLEIAIFGNNWNLINILPPFMFGLLFLTIITGFAYDIQRESRFTSDTFYERMI